MSTCPSPSRRAAGAALTLALTISSLSAQQGDRPGHVMTPPPAHWKIPPAPVVPAEQAAETMTLEDGFQLELLVSEPLVQEPVALTFDGMGRIWVAEMVGYMPDVDGKLEDSTFGRISVLEDRDGDGKIDRHTVFLDKPHLPRAVALVDADRRLLYADNERLYEVEILIDAQGHLRPGASVVVDENYAAGGNPEHKANGLMRGLDNWIYSAKSEQRYKKVGDQWISEKTESRGQWGISQDNYGRLLTNTNSNLVSVEELPPGLRVRNPYHSFRVPVVSTVKDQSLWPGRINPGVNRGYLEGTLDEKGYLRTPTAASGLVYYRGDQFPEAYQGQIFVPEPSGNLVKRLSVEEDAEGRRLLQSATPGREFLTSTDERSRIVNVYNAPDGSLYLLDLYRGILQHRVYMTSYLRAQVLERGLDKHIGLGRIWRVTHRDGQHPTERPRLSEESSVALVSRLSHPNGWWRDTAQRLIVERGGIEAVPALQALVAEGEELAAIHALWTLEGLGAYDAASLQKALGRPEARLAAEAVRAAESLAAGESAEEIFALLSAKVQGADLLLRRQLAASLGLFGERSVPLLLSLVQDQSDDLLLGDLALSGSEDHMLALFRGLAPEHNLRTALILAMVKRNDKSELAELLPLLAQASEFRVLARAAVEQRRIALATDLLQRLADKATDSALRQGIVEGLLAGGKVKGFKPMPVKELAALERAREAGVIDEAKEKALAQLFDVGLGEERVYLLTEADKRQFREGELQYQRVCLACHQADGKGQQYLAPPLVSSEWVLGPEQRLIALILDGLTGPIEVLGKTYTVPEIQPVMPGLRVNPDFSDEQLAAVMTYIRNAWGNGATPISAERVKRYRESVAPRAPWTAEELLKVE